MSSSASHPCQICQAQHEIPLPSDQAGLTLLLARYRESGSADEALKIRATIDRAVASLATAVQKLTMEQHHLTTAREEEQVAREGERECHAEMLNIVSDEVEIAGDRDENEKGRREMAEGIHRALRKDYGEAAATDTGRTMAALRRERDGIKERLRATEADGGRRKAAGREAIDRLTEQKDRLLAELSK
ncbi:uncharacterized protein BDZ99DRAFT_519883 [Mytilinidion resinicola]|uniref:Uncharacterized protein n=1 Tax=Mytilinidion resinicola TaxID=574789 RepID=A0A6A6YRP5_9PEZI|nr:uncharacterized protein BDZ99DRAFT_519883 [Mytilinidion resinicola]KAF2811228.1 hypothetical protein BDZ99DRAFT_519883 [Mytilinidion resinicola]